MVKFANGAELLVQTTIFFSPASSPAAHQYLRGQAQKPKQAEKKTLHNRSQLRWRVVLISMTSRPHPSLSLPLTHSHSSSVRREKNTLCKH